MNGKSEGRTKTFKIRNKNGNERDFDIKGITHLVVLQKKDNYELFFIKNEKILENIDKKYDPVSLFIGDIKIELEENLIKSIEKEKIYNMNIIKLEEDVLYMYTYLKIGHVPTLHYIKFITKNDEFVIGAYDGSSNKKCVINFEKGMRGIYGTKDENSKITEIGFFYEKYEEIETKRKNNEKSCNIPRGRFLKNNK
jgi:hypothetical protein